MTSRIPPSRRDPLYAPQRAAKVVQQQTPGAGRVAGAARPGVSDAVAAALRGKPAGGALPAAALGGLLVSNGSGWAVLPVGSDGQVLMADSGSPLGVTWGDQGTTSAFQAVSAGSANTSSLTFTLPLTPSTGQLLVAAFNVSQYGGARTVTVPAGWTQIEDVVSTANTNDRLTIMTKTAGAAEGTSFPFTFTSSEHHAGVLMAINVAGYHGLTTLAAGGLTTSTVTEDTTGDSQPFALFLSDGGKFGATTATGWTIAASADDGGFHGIILARRTAPTTASEAVSTSVTWSTGVAINSLMFMR